MRGIHHIAVTGLILSLALSLAACKSDGDRADASADRPEPIGPHVEAREAPGVHNLFRVTDKLYSGSQPEGDAAFKALADMGVRTIITVDGAAPDVEAAGRHGIRYVHLPIGYDGIRDEQAMRIAKAANDLDGPIFVHCHHGKHRGPAAVAICAKTLDGWTDEQAVAWLKRAGTSSDYAGLYAVSERFDAPTPEQLAAMPADFPQVTRVDDMVAAMVSIDERWEHLTAVKDAGWKAPPNHPDIDPAHEATLLWEAYREMGRTEQSVKLGEVFLKELSGSEAAAGELKDAIAALVARRTPESTARADTAFAAVAKGCKSCHKGFRN